MLDQELNYRGEAPYDRLAATGLSADYVARETRRAVDGVAGSATQIWPGVDIDVPVSPGSSRCTPESVAQAVRAVFRGGAHGIILSRNYTEMKPTNLAGAGGALRELGRIAGAEALRRHCAQYLTGYKLPAHVEFRGALPKNPLGKVLRRRLREEWIAAHG